MKRSVTMKLCSFDARSEYCFHQNTEESNRSVSVVRES
jgi:hypothetical protein